MLVAIKKMNMLHKDDIKIKFKIPDNFNLSKESKIYCYEKEEFNASIIYTQTIPAKCQIKILYYPHLHLYQFFIEKLLAKKLNVLETIKPTSDSTYCVLDLKKSKILNIEDSGGNRENGNKFILITLDFCKKIINANLRIPQAEFSLTESGLHLVDELYSVESSFDDNNPYSFSLEEKEDKKINLGKYTLNFILKLEVFGEKNINELKIKRWPRLHLHQTRKETIEDENLLYKEIELVLILLSYFQNQKIHYTFGRIKRKSSVIEYNLTKEEKGFFLPKKSLLKENGISIYDYLNDCDFDFISSNHKFIYNIVNRFIYSEYLEGESRFMILYNLLEQTRNFFIQISKDRKESIEISDEFQFTIESKTKIDKLIKNKIKELSEFVIDNEKDSFKNTANKKVNFVKKKLMQNQFDIFFKYIEINLDTFNLDLQELLKIRNTIYHGHDTQSIKDKLKCNISNLRKLVYATINYVLYNKKNITS